MLDRESWLQERQTGIGASEAAACLGIVPSALEVYTRKIGAAAPIPDTIPMMVGRALEGTIAWLYQKETGREIKKTQVMLRAKKYDWLLATLDGVTEDGIVEFKTISVRKSAELGLEDDDVPLPWLAQVHHQMICSGEDKAEVAVLIGNEEFRIYKVQRNEEVCQAIIEKTRFVWDCVLKRTPPPPSECDDYKTILRANDRYESAIQATPAIEELAQTAHAYGELAGAFEEKRDACRGVLATLLGEASAAVAPSGWKVERKLINRQGYTVAPTSYPQLTIRKPKGHTTDVSRIIDSARQTLRLCEDR